MGHLPVLAEGLAVIGRQHDQRPAVPSGFEQWPEQRLERSVGRGDLALIRSALEPRGEGLGRVVGKVRLVQVHEAERALAAMLSQPAKRRLHRVPAGPLGHQERGVLLRSAEAVVVDLEARAEPEPVRERERADEGCRAPAVRPQERSQGGSIGRETKATIVPHAVTEGILPGEQVGVRGQGDHVVGVRALEAYAAGGEPVDPRRFGARTPVRAESIRAQGVDCDQQDAEAGIAPRMVVSDARAPAREHAQREGGHAEPDDRDPPPPLPTHRTSDFNLRQSCRLRSRSCYDREGDATTSIEEDAP